MMVLHNQGAEKGGFFETWVNLELTVDGRDPKQPPGMYKTLQIMA